ncbi:hypothetical protein AVEN_136064-1 [Araneus ventricosus]|uniref:Uncharacterized protein n=1 Tax=Araneus ventricosus TaxID=182803 RepID=A0A4Y2P1Q9_ARAVE|nr:hypothetical protein AVEN_136064-1 [Araneus ventricosus]
MPRHCINTLRGIVMCRANSTTTAVIAVRQVKPFEVGRERAMLREEDTTNYTRTYANLNCESSYDRRKTDRNTRCSGSFLSEFGHSFSSVPQGPSFAGPLEGEGNGSGTRNRWILDSLSIEEEFFRPQSITIHGNFLLEATRKKLPESFGFKDGTVSALEYFWCGNLATVIPRRGEKTVIPTPKGFYLQIPTDPTCRITLSSFI